MAASDSLAGQPPLVRGVADTVTVLPEVTVERERGLVPDRSTTTSVRMDRSKASRFQPVTVADALAAVPGVDLVKTGPWASRVSIRGLSGDRVLLMVDGVRMNSVRGHGVQPSLVSLDRLDAVELMPGAGSAAYGSDALGGVLNIVTQRSLFSDVTGSHYLVGFRGSEPGGSVAPFARARITGPSLGFEISGGVSKLDHLAVPDSVLPNSGSNEEDLVARTAGRLGRATADYEISHHAARDVGLPAFDGGGSTGSYPYQGRDAHRLELAFAGRDAMPDLRVLGVKQQLGAHFDETVSDDIYTNRGSRVGTRTIVTSDRVTTDISSVEPSLRFRQLGAARLFGEFRFEEADGDRLVDSTVTNLAGDITGSTHRMSKSVPPAWRRSYAGGIAAAPQVSGFKVESSVRYDYLASHADSIPGTTALDEVDERASGEVGLSRRMGTIEPYAHVGTGFRAPNLDERYFNSYIHGGLRLFGNPDLESEHSLSYEAGLRVDNEGSWLRGGRLSVYRSDVDDLITFVYVGMVRLVPHFQYRNVQRARLQGIEGTAQLRLGKAFVDLSAGYPQGEDLDTGKRLEDLGPARATFEILYPIPRLVPQGTFSTRVRWSDAIADVSEPLLRPAFSTTALEVAGTIAGVRAAFAVRNLFDHYYYEPQSFIPEPGRTFALSLRREFRAGWPL